MKNKLLPFGLFALTLIFGCGDNQNYVGVYTGVLVMEDGTHDVGITLTASGLAILFGFHQNETEGEWAKEKVGESKEEGIWANFEFPNYRMRFELSPENNDLRVVRISLRMKGKTVLRTLKLKKANPLLMRQ